MKLVDVWNANPAFTALAALKKPAKLAYRLMRYEQRYRKQFVICNEMHDQAVTEAAGVSAGTIVTIAGDSPEFAVFEKRFNELCDVECDLEPVGLTLEFLVDELDKMNEVAKQRGLPEGNVLSDDDLKYLEPFFQELPKPEAASAQPEA